MAYGTRAALDTLREVDFGDISATFAAVGTPFGDFVRIVCFNNSTDVPVYISDDGVNNKIRLAPYSFFLQDLSANKIRDDGMFLPVGTQIYVKEVDESPTLGAVWVEVTYAEGGK